MLTNADPVINVKKPSVPTQVQQISWHKYDFIGMLLLALVFFACSIAILVGAAQGRHYSLVLCSICSANVALVLYAAARYVRNLSSYRRRSGWLSQGCHYTEKVQVHAGIWRHLRAVPSCSHAVQAGGRYENLLRFRIACSL